MVLGCSQVSGGGLGQLSEHAWVTLVVLGASVGGLGSLSGSLWLVWGRYRCLFGWSWAVLDGLGPFSGLVLAVLGRSQGLCGRSWAALGAYVVGLSS